MWLVHLSLGTGLQIPPAAQQALQMSGSIQMGAVAAVTGQYLPCSCSSDLIIVVSVLQLCA